MKINNKILIGACVASLLTACDYENINTNPYEMTDEMGTWDGVAIGGQLTSMQQTVIPAGTQADATDVANQYQVAYNLSSDVWSGYFGQNNNWNGGNNNTTYYLQDGWVAATYNNSYTKMLAPWKKLRIYSENNNRPEVYALAQVVKISGWHRTLDSFGPMPYSHAADNTLSIPFDSEEEVFRGMLADLEDAIEELSTCARNGSSILPEFDAVYAGDATKWVKYANTLMLRLAMRVRYADASLAREYAVKAVNQEYGLMTVKDDEAKMNQGAGLQILNNFEVVATQYNECRMGMSMFSYLLGYEDPRLQAYFLPVTEANYTRYATKAYDDKYYGAIPMGSTQGKNDYYAYGTSKPNIVLNTPIYWMRASEAYFLRAEAALVWGGVFGDAESLYEQGIQTSFDENGVSASVADYIASGKQPANARDMWGQGSSTAPSTTTAEFTGTTEQKLEKIMIQKWIALFPNGHEAWTEWRRTGYPKLCPIANNRGASQGVTAEKGIRRMVYPNSFSNTEATAEVYNDAVSKLSNGTDSPVTNLWWDCK